MIIKDHSGLEGIPQEFFVPKKTQDLTDFLKKHPNRKFRIGSGLSGRCGAAVPETDEIYVSMLAFDELRWADSQGGIIYAGAGVSLQKIQEFAAAAGWFFPFYAGDSGATLGGLIAVNGGGHYALRYGKIENFIKGIDFCDVNGRSYSFGGAVKNVSDGPSFYKSIIGSEGTLGFITGAYISCVLPPEQLQYLRIAHEDFFRLLPIVPTLLKMNPFILEMADQSALRFSSEVEESVIWLAMEEAVDMAQRLPFNVSLVDESAMQERFDIEKNISNYKSFTELDISFPLGQSMPILSGLKNIFESALLEHIFFGHAALGHWHICIFESDNEKLEAAIAETDRLLWRHQGNLSGALGIGKLHQSRLENFASDDWKWSYRILKNTFDPQNRLPSLIKI